MVQKQTSQLLDVEAHYGQCSTVIEQMFPPHINI